MNHIAAIRTNKWTEEEERLLAALRPYFGDDLVVVFHNRPGGVEPPVDVVDITDEWVHAAGLRPVADWGWRCGDYFYYRLREARPEYEYYWLIEPDVYFGCEAPDFFECFAGETADAIGLDVTVSGLKDNRFAKGLKGVPPARAIFALTRLSGRLTEALREQRAAQRDMRVREWVYPNDEIFTFSYAMADDRFFVKTMEDVAGNYISPEYFTTNPDMLLDVSPDVKPEAKGKVLHPLLGREMFKRTVGKRLAQKTGFLANMRPEIEALAPDELDEIADIARVEIRKHLENYEMTSIETIDSIDK